MSLQMSEEDAKVAGQWVEREWSDVDPHTAAHEYGREIDEIIDQLNSLGHNDIIGLISHSRASLREILPMLAQDIRSGRGHATKLGQFKGIKVLSLLSVQSLPPGTPLPQQVLSMAFQKAKEGPYILSLEHLEALAEHHAITDLLRGELTRPSGALVIGLYEEKSQRSRAKTAVSQDNIQWLSVHEFSKSQALRYLKEQHGKDWETRGFSLAKGTFDEVFELFRGMWINLDHATLPLLFVKLGEATVRFLERAKQSDGDQEVQDAIEDALAEINRLLSFEWPRTSDARTDQPLQRIIEKARQVIEQQYRGDRTLRPDKNGLISLEAKHVLTTLFSDRSPCSFHFPGNEPDN